MIRAIFQQASENLNSIAETGYFVCLEQAVNLLVERFRAGNKLLIFGNGGSAADAQHISGELMGKYLQVRPGLPSIALTVDPVIMTAWANDTSFDQIFARQIEALGTGGDVAWGISTSGLSPNVLAGLESARRLGLRTIGLTGPGGGHMAPLCDVLMAAPVTCTPRIQEVHMVTYHAICEAVERALFPAKG
jgi:D-sedoheptulose 7-phosphate isomerase